MLTRLIHSVFRDWTEGRRTPGLLCFGLIAKPLSWIYRLGAMLDGWLRRPRLAELPGCNRLIIVSSPVVGGVGKTPLVAYLASVLLRLGHNTHVVTTGYRRRSNSDVSLGNDSRPVSALDAGDEAVMIWRMTRAPVHVGDNLSATVCRVVNDFNPDFLVLDNGVRRRWKSETRIVVLTPADLERPVRYLPDGRWRIPPNRTWPAAGVAIIGVGQSVSHLFDASTCKRHERILRAWGNQAPVGWYASIADGLVSVSDESECPVDVPPDMSPFAFCAIGSPWRFARQIEILGLAPSEVQRFPDHHAYSAADMAELDRRCRQRGARWMLTTHKDAVKIDPAWAMSIPVFWLRIRLELAAGVDMLSVALEKSL